MNLTKACIIASLLGYTMANTTATTITYKCDDATTGDNNAKQRPLTEALKTAKANNDAAFKALETFNSGKNGTLKKVKAAEENLSQAQAVYDLTSARVTLYHKEYNTAAAAFKNCNPDAGDNTCDINKQSQLQITMSQAGDRMITNDNANNKNKNEVEALSVELNKVKAEYQFASASASSGGSRLEADLKTAAQTYQKLKDDFDKLTASDSEAQNECMISQYHNDVAEVKRLETLLKDCKDSDGCTIKAVKALGFKDVTGGSDGIISKTTLAGKIAFPDCGLEITEECFWTHYKKSGWLDFISFFWIMPAIFTCALFDEYEYNFCIVNLPYVMVDAYSRKAAPPQPAKTTITATV